MTLSTLIFSSSSSNAVSPATHVYQSLVCKKYQPVSLTRIWFDSSCHRVLCEKTSACLCLFCRRLWLGKRLSALRLTLLFALRLVYIWAWCSCITFYIHCFEMFRNCVCFPRWIMSIIYNEGACMYFGVTCVSLLNVSFLLFYCVNRFYSFL